MIDAIQTRAARAILEWSIDEFAEKSGVSRQSLHAFLTHRTQPHKTTLLRIADAFDRHGIELIDGGARIRQDVLKIYEGQECYVRLLDDILASSATEVLFSGADEQRNTPESSERFCRLRGAGVKLRSLIKDGDTYYTGPPEEYRWMPEDLFVDGDVKVMYGNCVAYLMSWLSGQPRVIRIRDQYVAQESVRMFEHIWSQSEGPHAASEGRGR